ncbi:MAG: universal stress protein [Deltaproteobacteria bacterium]|nr:universal stress protein [Deltaproteobacteria bacterium]
MIKALISVNPDLASSLALRFICRISRLTGMEMQTFHVVEPSESGQTPGTGWVRRTWEQGLLDTARARIFQVINAEKTSCPSLGAPKIVVGDRDREIIGELETGRYDLFVEGMLYSFSPSNFNKKIGSALYRNLPCPVILVKNLVGLEQGICLLGEGKDDEGIRNAAATFLKIFGDKIKVPVDLLLCDSIGTGREPTSAGMETSGAVEKDLDHSPKGVDLKFRRVRAAEGTAAQVAELLRPYGLVITEMSGAGRGKSHLHEVLSRVVCPLLLFRR